MKTAVLLVLAGVLASCAGTRPVASAPAGKEVGTPDLSAYRLGIGDRIRIDVFGEADLSVNAEVDPTGEVAYPLLGAIPALKKTASELEQTITKRLAGGYLVNPDVRVTVVQYRPFYVTGQVNRAGAYPYSVGLTVEKALALAGGLTRIASMRGIYLLHEDMPTDKRERVSLGSAVLPGDTLIVEESLF